MNVDQLEHVMEGKEPETPQEALVIWDKGWGLWSVEVGGIGPSYEQAIQIAAMEIIRDEKDNAFPSSGSGYGSWGEKTLHRVGSELGLSGAQADAARELAYRAFRDGWRGRNDSARKYFKEHGDEDRMIQIRKEFGNGRAS